MTTEQKKIPAPFASEEEFQRIYMDCMANSPQASDEVIKWRDEFGAAHDEYVAAVSEQDFRYGYECGWNAAMKGGVQA